MSPDTEVKELRDRVVELADGITARDQRIEMLEEQLIGLRARAELADSVMEQIRSITAGRAQWEVEALKVKQKWEGLLQATRHELTMAQKGLTSGCGCPIGKCLGATRGASCWMQWAHSSAMVQAATQVMDKLLTDSVHPRRFTSG